MMKIHAFTHSAGRPINEDTFLLHSHDNKIVGTNHSEFSFTSNSYPLTIAVLDGVGGHELGGEAANMVAYTVIENPIEAHNIKTVLTKANDCLCSQPGHGFTTITALQIDSLDRASFISCGDSRLYLIKEQQLIQLSRDDSTASVLENVFKCNQKEAHQKSRLTQCLGQNAPTLNTHDILVDEHCLFLLATDGAYSFFENYWDEILRNDKPEDFIIELLKSNINAEEIDDNITAITLLIN